MAGVDVLAVGVVLGGLDSSLLEQLPLKNTSLVNGDLTGSVGLAVVREQVAEVASAVRADPLGDGEGDVGEVHSDYLPFYALIIAN